MLTKQKLVAIGASFVFTLTTLPSQAAEAGSTQQKQPSDFEKLMQEVKNPTDWLSWGGDIRVRNEYYNEIVTLGKSSGYEQDLFRFRGRIWATVTPVTNLTLNGRLSAEPRLWMKPSFVGAYKGQTGMEWRYGLLDNLNVKWDHILNQPLTITAGRQDILLGDYYDWWLVADGTPGDGSWSFYLDSIRLAWQPEPLHTRFDFIYIQQNSRPDEWIPTIGSSVGYSLTDQDERGVVVYASNKSIKNMQLDGYFIYKHDEKDPFYSGNKAGDNGDIYTLGGKVTGTLADHWQYSVEGAYQFGQKEDRILGVTDTRNIDAYGGKAKLTYLVKDKLNNQFSLMGEFLSGDDPKTGSDEMFDVLWGRWPRWSELYIYSYIVETGGRVAQLNNIGRVGPGWTITPAKGLTFGATYNVLLAPEQTPTRAIVPGAFSDSGNFRGHYVQAVVKYQFNKNLSGHLWGEGIWQGDYYKNRDLLSFLRAEVMLSF